MSRRDGQSELCRAYSEHLAREIRGQRFKVWIPRRRYFATLTAACAAAEDYRKRTGVFVAITEQPRRTCSQ